MLILIDHIIILFFALLIKAIIFNFKLNMEQSFKNENKCDVLMNEVRMEDEPL
jgi:hypothetical protein